MVKDYPLPLPKKSFRSLSAPRSGYATTIMVFFVHLLIFVYPNHHQNLISSPLYYPGPLHKISSQSVHNFWVMLSIDKQTDKQTNQRYQKHNLVCQGGNYLTNYRTSLKNNILSESSHKIYLAKSFEKSLHVLHSIFVCPWHHHHYINSVTCQFTNDFAGKLSAFPWFTWRHVNKVLLLEGNEIFSKTMDL